MSTDVQRPDGQTTGEHNVYPGSGGIKPHNTIITVS